MNSRYERVNTNDDEHTASHGDFIRYPTPPPIPNSPPPSFHSVVGPPVDSALQDSFDAPSDNDDDDGDLRTSHSRRIQHSNVLQESIPLIPTSSSSFSRQTAVTPTPTNTQTNFPKSLTTSSRVIGESNDGVFANLSAKPTVGGEKLEEQPPSYEQAAADAPPPFWETTILAPGLDSNEVFIDGLPVGSVFAFVWNAMISMFFQLVGFLLTYLLHTTHAAKNGSRAGLGITLIQYGFYLRSDEDGMAVSPPAEAEPSEPNSYEFSSTSEAINEMTGNSDSISRSEWLSYIFMIVGWFILIRAVSDFLRARRTEQLVLQSPDRGLGIAVIPENETPERSV